VLAGCGEAGGYVATGGGVSPPLGEGMFALASVQRVRPSASAAIDTTATVSIYHDAIATTPVRYGYPFIEYLTETCFTHSGRWSLEQATPPSLGAVTLTGTPRGEVELADGPDGYAYAAPTGGGPAWNAGDVITVSAEGAVLPSFRLSGEVPSAPLLLSPTERATVLRGQPLTVNWVEQPGEVLIGITQYELFDGKPLGGIVCSFPAVGGIATIPAAVTDALHSPEGIASNVLTFAGLDHLQTKIDALVLDLSFTNGVTVPIDLEE
jgi:hypothetical protein